MVKFNPDASVHHVFRADPTNVGDWWCPPFRALGLAGDSGDIKALDLERLGGHVVLGGGGLISVNFDARMRRLAEHRPRLRSLVAWGVGESMINDKSGERVARYDGPLPDYLKAFDLVGLRDWGTAFRWVPCASCLLPAFDRPGPVRHAVVVYEHKRIPVPIEGLPRLTNDGNDLERALQFLASGETVVTNSYHGAYWATLLGRRVIALPSLSKMYRFRHAPVLAWHDDWRAHLDRTTVYPEALEECRQANRDFQRDVAVLQAG